MRDKMGRFVKGSNEWIGRKHREKTKQLMKTTNKNKGIKCRFCGIFKSKNKIHTCPKHNHMKGKKRPELIGNKLNWKGGLTKRSELIRNSPEYKLWRSRVFERDNWVCQTCGIRGGYLEAHHLMEMNKIIKKFNIKTAEEAKQCDELWNLNNGVTLCKECHSLTKCGKPKK